MKKLSMILVILLTIFGIGGWIYCADQFERQFKMALSKLDKTDLNWIEIDSNKVQLKKYRFSAKINDVVFLSKSERYKIVTDVINVRYNPFSKSVSLSLSGENVTIGVDDDKMYVKNPNILIRTDIDSIYNKEIFDVELCAKDLQIYYGVTQDIIYSAQNFEHVLSIENSNLSNDNLKLSLTTDWKEFEFFPNDDWIKRYLLPLELKHNVSDSGVIPNFADKYLNMLKHVAELLRTTGPINFDGTYHLDIKKEYVYDLLKIIYDGHDMTSIINKIDFQNSKYHFDAAEHYKNASINNKLAASIKKPQDDQVQIIFEIESNTNYDDKILVNIKDTISDILFTAFTFDDTQGRQNKLSKNDFTNMAGIIADIKQCKLHFDMIINNDNTVQIDMNNVIDNYQFAFNGKLQKRDFSGSSLLSDPQSVIQSIVNTYDSAISPIIAKLYQHNPSAIKMSNMFVDDIKNNGYEALLALHKEDTLKEGESLKTDWSFDGSNFHLKINGNSFWKIMTDERLIKFMQNLPDAKKYENDQKELQNTPSHDTPSNE